MRKNEGERGRKVDEGLEIRRNRKTKNKRRKKKR